LWKQGSPITHIKAGNPPFLVVHGDKDTTVPHTQSDALVAVLQKAGVLVKLITVKRGGHGMSAAQGDPPAEPDPKDLNAAVLAFFDTQLKK